MNKRALSVDIDRKLIMRFKNLSYSDRLKWLEEVHRFISLLPEENRKRILRFRKERK